MRYVRVQDGHAVEDGNFDSIEGRFHPALLWVVADTAQIGDLWDGSTFTTPAPIPMPEPERIARLWQAAHDLEYAAISGSAIGLITMGVLGGKPKCLAVQGWIKDIWTEYYARKAGTSTDCDFATVAGLCPHSVPELMVELGV